MTDQVKVVILAGGKGTRLAPYTTVLPKPLMPIGDMPILEVVLRQLRAHGFRKIVLSVGHLAELIRAFCGDGSRWGMDISYVVEDTPLGTIGPLRLVEGLDKPFLVMNGDLLTDVDYRKLYEHHVGGTQSATIAAATRDVHISLGVLEVDATRRLVGFQEKPTHSFTVSMGIYVFSPDILELVPDGRHYGFDNLMLDMIRRQRVVRTFPFDGLWLDIGRHEDYELAVSTFEANPKRFLPDEHARCG